MAGKRDPQSRRASKLFCPEKVLATPEMLFIGRPLRLSSLSSCLSVGRPMCLSTGFQNPDSGAQNGARGAAQRIPIDFFICMANGACGSNCAVSAGLHASERLHSFSCYLIQDISFMILTCI